MDRYARRLRTAMISSSFTALLIGAHPAFAADASGTEALVESIAASCHPGADGRGVVTASDLRAALSKAYPIDPWSTPDRVQLISAIKEAGVNPGPLGSHPDRDADAISRTGLIVHGWLTDDPTMLSVAKGGVAVVQANHRPLADQDLEEVLRTIFFRDDANPRGFQFICMNPQQQAHAPVALADSGAARPSLTIAKAPNQLGKLKGDDQKAGEISFTDDRVKGSPAFATTIAVGVRIPFANPSYKSGHTPRLSFTDAGVIPFISYERQGSNDPSEKSYVNNLSFGAQTNGYLHVNGADGHSQFQAYYALVGRYETDDGFHSSAWFGELDLEPLFDIAGNATPHFFPNDGLTGFGFSWSTTGVFDHSSVTDPWQKQALIDTRHYTRLGGDLSGSLLLRRWKGRYDLSGDYAWSVELNTTLSERWNLGSGGGSAHLWSSKLSFSPSKNYSFSIGYDQGYELDSLAQRRQWKITLDLKK